MKSFFWGLLALGSGMSMCARAQTEMEPFREVIGHTVIYHLYISDTLVNYTGRRRHAIAVNGQLPGPTLEFTQGDTAEIHIHNEMMMETSVHWHGLIVPNQYDGVSWLSGPPIRPMQTYVAKFPLVQNGTYWYHSHTMLQEQIGLYGALIIHKRPGDRTQGGENPGKAEAPLPEEVVLFSDWTDEKPYEVNRSLHYATDWYAIKKHSTQDYAAAIKDHHLHTKLLNEWKRMLPMDVSDVAYDLFTVNGSREEAAVLAPGSASTRNRSGSTADHNLHRWPQDRRQPGGRPGRRAASHPAGPQRPRRPARAPEAVRPGLAANSDHTLADRCRPG